VASRWPGFDRHAKGPYDRSNVTEGNRVRRSALVSVLLWDFGRESVAYDLALAAVVLLLLLVPGGFWGDPLWRP